MADIDKERDRLDQLGQHIEEAEAKARDLLEPHGTLAGGPRSMDGDEPGGQERVTPGSEVFSDES